MISAFSAYFRRRLTLSHPIPANGTSRKGPSQKKLERKKPETRGKTPTGTSMVRWNTFTLCTSVGTGAPSAVTSIKALTVRASSSLRRTQLQRQWTHRGPVASASSSDRASDPYCSAPRQNLAGRPRVRRRVPLAEALIWLEESTSQ